MECNFENCPNFERLGKQFAERISELEKENKELKKFMGDTVCDCTEKTKYSTALQEIKELAEKIMLTDLCGNCDGIGLDGGCINGNCAFFQMDKILDIINKAEE